MKYDIKVSERLKASSDKSVTSRDCCVHLVLRDNLHHSMWERFSYVTSFRRIMLGLRLSTAGSFLAENSSCFRLAACPKGRDTFECMQSRSITSIDVLSLWGVIRFVVGIVSEMDKD